MNGNLKLIDALRAVTLSLNEGSVDYNWDKISQDNVGLLAQAITRTDRVSLYEEYLKEISSRLGKRRRISSIPSWTDMVAEYWPMTGSPIVPIFIEMREAGVKRSDIYDLEYLTGKIGELADISKESVDVEYTEVRTETKNFILFKKDYEVTQVKTKNLQFFKQKNNLIKFYNTWISELEKSPNGGGSLYINGETFPYRNSFQLEKLKNHFLSLENYEAANIVQKELEKYKK